MNYIEQFMKDNDIEINEEFYVVNLNGYRIEKFKDDRFHFGVGLFLFKKGNGLSQDDVLCELLLGSLKIEKISQKPKTVWDLKDGDEYYYIDICGNFDITTFGVGSYWADKKMIEIGNVFLTREEAEFEVERRKCESILLKYGTRDMISLGDKYTKKYYIQYDYDVNKIIIFKHYSLGIQGSINFKTEELAQKAIQECGEERLKKYVFNVKE